MNVLLTWRVDSKLTVRVPIIVGIGFKNVFKMSAMCQIIFVIGFSLSLLYWLIVNTIAIFALF